MYVNGAYLQVQGEQLQRPDSQVQEEPHLHLAARFKLAFSRFFD